MSVREIVLEEIRRVAADRNETLARLTDDLSPHESALDLLCFKVLVARLEHVTGPNPP